jgi:hypothetical protein
LLVNQVLLCSLPSDGANTEPLQIDWQAENRKQEYLEALYQISGRENGLYTGLVEDRKKRLMEWDQALLLDGGD